MTNELVSGGLESVLAEVRVNGSVIVDAKTNRTILVRPYHWQAGLYHLIHDHVRQPERHGEWCTVECFARFVDKTATAAHIEDARPRIAALHKELLDAQEFLVIDYSGPGGAKSAMRLLLPNDDSEVTAVQIRRMLKMRDTSEERAKAALSAIDAVRAKRKLAELPPPEPGA